MSANNTDKKTQTNEGLFDEKSLDEMQKAENYKIGFKLFQACFWFMYFFSCLIYVTAVKTENTLFAIYGIAAMAADSVFHIIYSAMVSAKGVMNSKYAETMAKPYTIPVYTFCLIAYGCLTLTSSNPDVFFMIVVPYIMIFLDCVFARRNKKVLEKMLKENDEEE